MIVLTATVATLARAWPFIAVATLTRAWLFIIAVILILIPTTQARAQWIQLDEIPSPLLDVEPFDLLILNKDAESAILKIIPLSDPIPNPKPSNGTQVFEFANSSGEKLQVPFSSISQHKTFNQLLVEEANRWLTDDDYFPAFRNLLYVYDHGGKGDAAVEKSLRNCLFLDGKQNFQENRFELALSIFEDLYREDPDFKVPGIDKGLIEIVMLCYDGIIEKEFVAENYLNIRGKLDSISNRYPNHAKSLKEKWEQSFAKRGDELMKGAKELADAGKGRQAHLAIRKAEQVNPGRAEIKQLQETILQQYPLIVIGVSQSAANFDSGRIEHWGARRVGRLIQRTIVELTGQTDEGGKYTFLNGTLTQIDEIGLKYRLEISAASSVFAAPPITAFEVSTRLLETANPRSESYNVAWAKVLKTVSIVGENQVLIELRTPFVLPEALMDIPYVASSVNSNTETTQAVLSLNAASADAPSTTESGFQADVAATDISVTQNGIYVIKQIDRDITTFEFNPIHADETDEPHPVLIEQTFPTASAAVDDLIKGNIDIVDRIPVADLKNLNAVKREKGIVVRPYLLPTVHMLVPKVRGELTDNPYFRSGLSHAIDREALVRDAICDKQIVEGCLPISGPFPIGTDDNDQISYAYDMKIKPIHANIKLAMVLLELAYRPTSKRPDALKPPNLIIAHPDSSAASEAAAAIARAWSLVGVPTETRMLKPGETIPPDQLWDFLYLEVTMQEPLTDIRKIFGQNGFASDISAPAEQTLRLISTASNWRAAGNALRRLHRQLSVDQSVIPLWQIKEHYAYRNTVRGIGRDLIHLYQNVDRWQIESVGSDEQE